MLSGILALKARLREPGEERSEATEERRATQSAAASPSGSTPVPHLPYRVPELRRNGDFLVALDQVRRSTMGGAGEAGDSATLTDQLERLLSITGIRAGVPGYEIIACAASSPLPALRAAAVATRLVIALRGQNPEQERQFNVLRAELLLGVAGVPWSLDEESLTRCLGDCEILIHCLVGALSDVASTTSDERKREAMERYSRVCSIVFR